MEVGLRRVRDWADPGRNRKGSNKEKSLVLCLTQSRLEEGSSRSSIVKNYI